MFDAFTPLAGGGLEDYRDEKEYPYDLNGALDFTRPASGVAVYGYPDTIGYIDGLVPMMTAQSQSTLFATPPNMSPWTGAFTGNMDDIFPNYQGLTKETK